jgi:hypothetical protein
LSPCIRLECLHFARYAAPCPQGRKAAAGTPGQESLPCAACEINIFLFRKVIYFRKT